MFSQEHRLRLEKDVRRALKSKRGVFDAACGMRWVARMKADMPVRLAIVIGTKIDKRAVVRNRNRRQYREVCKEFLPFMKTGYDLVLFVGKPALTLDYDQKRERLARIFAKSGLLVRSLPKQRKVDGNAADRGVSKDVVV